MWPRVAGVVKSRANQRGRKQKDRAAPSRLVRALPVNIRKNQRVFQNGADISPYLVQILLKEGYMRRCLKQTRPLLTLEHQT